MSENITYSQLITRQALPLEGKILLSKQRIREFYRYFKGKVYVSFSGGKDSTVLLHLVRTLYPDVEAVFVDTGLEFPEIKKFAMSQPNTTILRPSMTFTKVIEKYGYPVVSKKVAGQIEILQRDNPKYHHTKNLILTGYTAAGRYSAYWKLSKKWLFLKYAPFKISDTCCDVMKKAPIARYEKATGKVGYVGLLASDSFQRKKQYLKRGCNYFGEHPKSNPLGFWLEKDIWDYLHTNDVVYCSIYDMGYERTGCIYCMFGLHLDKTPNRFERMKTTHPQLYEYCMTKLGLSRVLEFVNNGEKKKETKK